MPRCATWGRGLLCFRNTACLFLVCFPGNQIFIFSRLSKDYRKLAKAAISILIYRSTFIFLPISLFHCQLQLTKAQYTPPTPRRRNCRVSSRRRRRCVLGLRKKQRREVHNNAVYKSIFLFFETLNWDKFCRDNKITKPQTSLNCSIRQKKYAKLSKVTDISPVSDTIHRETDIKNNADTTRCR